jgi:hypothetical protein
MSLEYHVIKDLHVRICMQYVSGMFQEYAVIHHKDELLDIMKADNEIKHYSITVK